MNVWTKSPVGIIAHINLDAIPIYRLELAPIPSNQVNTGLGVGFRYVVAGTTSFHSVVALDIENIPQGSKVCNEIAMKSLRSQSSDRVMRSDENKRAIREAMKTLTNVFDKNADLKRVTEYEAASAGLIDTYEALQSCLQTGAEDSGEYQGYHWVVTQEQYGWNWADPSEKQSLDEA